jgi:hypothetical protein
MFSIRYVTRSPIGGAETARWLLLQGRGWDHSRGFDRPRVAEGLLLGAHADRGQDLLHLRACLSEVFHRQGALSEVEVEVLNSSTAPRCERMSFSSLGQSMFSMR